MRTYDPADSIRYVHMAQDPVVRPTPAQVSDECDRLPADYANVSLRARIVEPPTAGARPALVLLPGGSAAGDGPAPSVPALRLAQ